MDSPPPARLGSEAVSERLANPAQRRGGDMAWASIAPAAPLQGLGMRLTPLTLPMERLVVSIEYWIWTRRKFRLGSAFGQKRTAIKSSRVYVDDVMAFRLPSGPFAFDQQGQMDMLLTSVKVGPFRSINEQQTTEIDPQVTVLVGMNEAG